MHVIHSENTEKLLALPHASMHIRGFVFLVWCSSLILPSLLLLC